METLDITKMSKTELESMAYKVLVQIEQANGNLRALQAQMQKVDKESEEVPTNGNRVKEALEKEQVNG